MYYTCCIIKLDFINYYIFILSFISFKNIFYSLLEIIGILFITVSPPACNALLNALINSSLFSFGSFARLFMIILVFLNKFPPNSLNVFASVSSIYLPCHSLEFDSYQFPLYTLNPYKDCISVLFFCQFICYFM